MTEPIRWGILGTGNIAGSFATGLQSLEDAELVAVGSRTKDTADVFGDRFDIDRRHASYDALAGDPEVDAIYVATPHSYHMENSILCLEAGKAVLCEKPFAMNIGEAEKVVHCARERGIFLMEAMWTRFLPALVQVRQWLSDSAIGEVRMLAADFGFRANVNPDGRLFNPSLGGGGLLDVGIYPVSLASLVFADQPSRISGLADIGDTGVDEQGAMVLGYDSGQIAVLYCAVRTDTPMEATIMGTEGSIRIESPFWKATSATLSVDGKDPVQMALPFEGNGYNYEAAEVGRCLRAGLLENYSMPLEETLGIMRTLDSIRAHWGLRYPAD
ncbi:MAG: Gfo/Idh/MocA family oxidoreductase [Gemmatimonadota bacterium]|nr:Gfo/Idh/MocA family oxidoreductase [Gemmatimonadota bacterium]